ncbi:UDP-glucuronosyl/UDP-glucosyltransferase [Macleaya cordata]|uniref:UDP-glucuronosyl/UDP-glucosyltransferase n=1 Tax=Macleaya cordata TaxID=56857 RepID=A0A200QPN6_MACCD|nr:UDP-glucuronosyl/UDP-glucosyltransferase [Macleaya cordata]
MKCLQKKPRMILVPYPAQGHVTPMLHLATSLYDRGFEPIIVVPAFIYRRIVSKFENNEKIILMSIPDGLDDENQVYDFFSINYSMENHMPVHLDKLLIGSSSSLQEDADAAAAGGGLIVCLIVDLLASWAIDVAVRRRVPVAGFWPAMFATYKLITAIPDMIRHGYISEFGKFVII